MDEQLDVLEHPLNESLFVAGPPGSGKTVLATTRAQAVANTVALCFSPTIVCSGDCLSC